MRSFKIFAYFAALFASLAPALRADSGLLATYADGKNTIQTIVTTPTFSLKDNESVHPQIAPNFTATYEGSLKILRRAAYTFSSDAKISLDGKQLTGPIQLDPGEHPITITYRRQPGPARLHPLWSSDQFISEPLLASLLSHNQTPDKAQHQSLIERGRLLIEEHNCAACHKESTKILSSRIGPDLTNIGARASVFWIYKWLENPKHFRAAAVMPILLSSDDDRRDVAAYLANLKDPRKNITEPKLSDSRRKQGKELFDSIGCANCHTEAGSSLIGLGSKTTIGQLAAYLENPLSVDRSGRMPGMQLTREEATAIADHLTQSKSPDFEGELPQGADANRGQQIVRTTGCLNCHTIDGDAGKPLPESKKFAALEKLDPAKGCLAPTPPQTAARYQLSPNDRAAIAALLTAIKTAALISSAPAHEFHRTLQKLNCAACHETDQSKPAEEIEKLPPLTHVGAKLKKDWINQVLTDKRARVRFWLKTRMPDFGPAISKLADQAVAAAGIDETTEPKTIPTAATVTQGQQLVGANDPQKNPAGMGCVTCHSLREFKPAVAADATRGPELTLMSTRLRPDFFRRWMHEPARIQAGTAMPNFFTDKPREEADAVINTLWAYASLGISMPPPIGVKEKKNYILIVTDTPIVSRCQVPDPNGTIVYGISVGLPGMINYTFDAQHVMFRTAWRGGFLDMTPDWNDRGGNPVKILGQRFYSQAINPIRIGTPDNDAPRIFKGYELKEKIPTFIYTIGDIEVRERITTLETGQGIIRTFELDPNNQPVFYIATDEPNTTLSVPNGQFKPTQVQKTFKSPDKTPGQLLQFPPAGKLTFAITIRAKEPK